MMAKYLVARILKCFSLYCQGQLKVPFSFPNFLRTIFTKQLDVIVGKVFDKYFFNVK